MNLKQHFRQYRWIYLIGILVALSALWYSTHADKDKKSHTQPPVAVSVAPALRRDIPLEVREVGNVVPYESVVVRSRLDSVVTEVHFKDGDLVHQGDLLFVLDDRALKAQALQLEANLRRDRAQGENSRLQFERSQKLAAQGFESAASLDQAKALYQAQRAVVAATEASLESIRVQLGYTRITAPITGRTGTIAVTLGNNVKANDTGGLVTINQIQPIRVQSALSQRYLDAVRNAMAQGNAVVLAEREGGAAPTEGTLEYIDNTVDPSTGTFAMRALFPNADEGLWPGMFVTLTIRLGEEKGALAVPEVAVQHGQEGEFLFVVQEGKAAKRTVTVARNYESNAVISTGLKEGEQVAVDGIMGLKDGSVVNVKTQEGGIQENKAE